MIEEFRANGDEVPSFGGSSRCYCFTTAAPRPASSASTVAYLEAGGGTLIFAFQPERQTNPDWYHNLEEADPQASIKVRAATRLR